VKNSLYITGNFSSFVESYIDAKNNKASNAIMYCLSSLGDCFSTWEQEFNSNDYHKNINLVTLYKLIAADNKPVATLDWKINTYKSYLNFYSLSFKDHLIECFLKHIEKETVVYSNYNKEYKLLYFLAREIKYSLFKIIRQACQLSKRDYTTNKTYTLTKPSFYKESSINLDLYFLFLKNRLLYSIILSIIYENISWKEIKQKYELSNAQFKKIKNEAHQWISKTL
jgi:hypothetical protein